MWKCPIFSALVCSTHSWINVECLLRRRGQGRCFPSLYTKLAHPIPQLERCTYAIFRDKDVDGIMHRLAWSVCQHWFCFPTEKVQLQHVRFAQKAEEDQIANIRWIIEKTREFQKNTYFCFIDYAKPLTVWTTINCGKFWKRREYQTTWPASWETYMQVRKQQLELDMEQQTGSK